VFSIFLTKRRYTDTKTDLFSGSVDLALAVIRWIV